MNESRPLSTLYDCLDFLSGLTDVNDIKIWSRLLEKLAAALQTETAVYFYYDTLSRQLVPFHAPGDALAKNDLPPISTGQGLAGWVAKFREPLMLVNPAADERYDAAADITPDTSPRNALLLPLHVNLDFVGVFAFYNREGGFNEDHLKLAKTIVRHASDTIRRHRLEHMVNRVTTYNASILDNLSGGFLAVDLQGRVMICNPAGRRMLGLEGESTDKPVEQALPGAPVLAAVLRETLSNKKTVKRRELPFRRGEEERLLGYSTLLIKDSQGSFAGAGVSFQDITNLKK